MATRSLKRPRATQFSIRFPGPDWEVIQAGIAAASRQTGFPLITGVVIRQWAVRAAREAIAAEQATTPTT